MRGEVGGTDSEVAPAPTYDKNEDLVGSGRWGVGLCTMGVPRETEPYFLCTCVERHH